VDADVSGDVRDLTPILLHDETLRDGLQTPSGRDASIEEPLQCRVFPGSVIMMNVELDLTETLSAPYQHSAI
jgi:hypothetical protein